MSSYGRPIRSPVLGVRVDLWDRKWYQSKYRPKVSIRLLYKLYAYFDRLVTISGIIASGRDGGRRGARDVGGPAALRIFFKFSNPYIFAGGGRIYCYATGHNTQRARQTDDRAIGRSVSVSIALCIVAKRCKVGL